MSDNGLPPTPPIESLSREELHKGRELVLGNLLEQLKPWLIEFGSWIFGGLIAFNLIIIAPMLTIGAVQLTVLVSIVTFACALPLNVSGLLVLRLTKDLNDIAIDDVMHKAFEDAHLPVLTTHEPLYKQRTDVGIRYASRLAALSGMLTLLGMIAALWYIAWWVGVVFIAAVGASALITMMVATRLMRPDTDQLRERYEQQRH